MGAKIVLGTLGALGGALAGALAWAGITAATSLQIGFMAVGVGFLAGSAMRALSGGREQIEGVIAGAVALLGCVVGNLLALLMVYAHHEHMSAADTALTSLMVLSQPVLAYKLSAEAFNLMDLVFYAIAVYAGYRTALKPPAASVTPVGPATGAAAPSTIESPPTSS